MTPRALDPTYERHLREVLEWSRKAPRDLIFRLAILIPTSGTNTGTSDATMINWLIKCLPAGKLYSRLDEITKHAQKTRPITINVMKPHHEY